jgi:hypothetical protein
METPFDEVYQTYSKDELFAIVQNQNDYQAEAVYAAQQMIKKKNWTTDFNNYKEEINKKLEAEQALYEQDIIEKAEYYKNVVEYKNQHNAFEIKIADIPTFESALNNNQIKFFREDKNIGAQLDTYPTQTYYFKNEDTQQVDEIVQRLSIVTAPYTDIKPFFGFEMKVVAVVIVVTIILVLLLK